MANETNERPAARGRRELYLIVGLLVLVMVGATVLYKMAERGVLDLPSLLGTSNNGVLITPPQHIDELGLRYADGSAFDFAAEDARWTFLVPIDANCQAACGDNLYVTRQVRTALGRDMDDVARLIVTTGAPNSELAELIAREHEGVPLLRTSGAALAQTFGELSKPIQPVAQKLILVVDPQGWMMMYYTPEQEGDALLDDMKFLLKYSPRQAGAAE